MKRGMTLVELMITVAMLGILAAGMGSATRHIQLLGLAELQQEQARLLLDHHASVATGQRPATLTTHERLIRGLPEAAVTTVRDGRTVTLVASWEGADGGPATRSLTVFVP